MITQYHKIALAAGIALALAFTLSCSSNKDDDSPGGGNNKCCNIADCKIAIIGTQTWMGENLNCDVPSSKCYDNDPANCAKYGRFYDWATAMGIDAKYNHEWWDADNSKINEKHKGICPEGWHIPSIGDWRVLRNYAGSAKLMATSGWYTGYGYIVGTDEYGFTALAVPEGSTSGASWWSASEDNVPINALLVSMDNVGGAGITYDHKYYSKSVRCLQD